MITSEQDEAAALTCLDQYVRNAAEAENVHLTDIEPGMLDIRLGYRIAPGTELRFGMVTKEGEPAPEFTCDAVYPSKDQHKLDILVVKAINDALGKKVTRRIQAFSAGETCFNIPLDQEKCTAEMRRYFRIHTEAIGAFNNYRTNLNEIAKSQGTESPEIMFEE